MKWSDEMKSTYIAPKLLVYGDIDALTQYVGPSPSDDSFPLNGSIVTADGSTGFLND
jgi:hypothetical protein